MSSAAEQGSGEPRGDDLERARELLLGGGRTLAAVCGDQSLMSGARGVRPLLSLIGEGKDLEGFSVADKVVGKAPALLYATLRPKAVYAPVMSKDGARVLRAHGIQASCGELVPRILNRGRDGQCPMDASVNDVEDPQSALEAIWACARRMAVANAARDSAVRR
ncbi:DUF1893 domain-containing protein [Olsenella porci]|uniref:DUF1893 domain-containing protein n=1 Tax=Olsenella porci TaxID=2652279 RepID=A0A6N7XT94_9ACTN|nr:DUF1893 domain-containing protein [Olsenella porci]MST73325.1 DUF1893 domain-containing protein [Olsenella porci]